MVSGKEIRTGDPVILVNAKGLKKYGLLKNMEGFCNSVVVIPEEGEYLMFQPAGIEKFFWVQKDRFALDEAKLSVVKEDEPSDV